ncbi:hypothetical protein [Flavobacterium johnsoniae]|uniref:Hypothetical lipoprotein n=2 Tax=Flavobacterium johnsoniae TaxID=986 RepID=A5F9S8_FLAJ1|nr:hypothetical protein [Flavobacterium johnsoniae]ABQ08044.1 hypothetical lipoprotein [Flavobacterium johnsoniae UW101]OXG02119.1 hypothetical protein B0A63_05540 [Flavobacterium johnsoniae UW101]WQG80110.1 hypothetical protein SR927_19075 [Flavobacterium johnsoniae UW101]SHK93840.1 hypothetical protein SAMN05444146_2408 [Flavobacterium johnsoniae]
MRKHLLYFLLTMFITTSFLSCASFSKKTFEASLQDLERENISKLEGNYALNPIIRYKEKVPEEITSNDKLPDSLFLDDAYQFMVIPNVSIKKKIYRKSENSNRSIALKFQSEKLLLIKVYQDSEVIKDTLLSGKLKKGMFYLDNKFSKCTGIPYFLGGCQSNKRRIGLSKNGNLLINEADSNNGAFLFLFWAGTDYNLTYEYQRK